MAQSVVVLDSQFAEQQALVAILEAESFAVEAFAASMPALDWLVANPAAVILVAQNIEGGEGAGILERVRKIRPSCQRILLSTDGSPEELRRDINTGTIQYLLLGLSDKDDLVATVDGAIARHIQQERLDAMGDLVRKQLDEMEAMSEQLESMVDRRTRQIERAKKEWERTFDAISSPLTQVGSGFELVRANVATALHADLPVRELPGSVCYQSIFGRTEPCESCPLNNEAMRRQGVLEGEIVDSRNGKTFLLSAYRFDSEAEMDRFVCYYKDVTEEKKLQRQVVQSEKMAGIGQLAGGVAHELNNPIGVVLSFTQFSKMTATEIKDEELLDNLQEIETAANRCKEIVAGLLDFSRPSQDQRVDLVNLNDILDKALFLVSTQRAAKDQEVVREFAPGSVLVEGNNNQLLQVFINLIQNAVHAMPEGGILRVSTGLSGNGQAYAEISDTGVGIAPDKVSRLFEPFYTTKEPGQGTGLGLSVSYGIVERHAGRIDVESIVGEGATFRVILPAAPGDDEDC
jgi:two-component system, NtrC family, sensor kinase